MQRVASTKHTDAHKNVQFKCSVLWDESQRRQRQRWQSGDQTLVYISFGIFKQTKIRSNSQLNIHTYIHVHKQTRVQPFFFQFFSCPPTLVVSFSHLASLHCSPYFFRTFLSLVFFVRIFLNVDVSICIFYKEMNGAKRKRGQKRRRNNNQFELDHLDQLDYYEKKKKRNTNMDFYEKENFIKYTPKKNRPDIANTCTYT